MLPFRMVVILSSTSLCPLSHYLHFFKYLLKTSAIGNSVVYSATYITMHVVVKKHFLMEESFLQKWYLMETYEQMEAIKISKMNSCCHNN